ncbi:MAG: glycosyltransferase, partial [Chlorobi bacterium]|nr:glycosyltransferase [Chlorobiota bacterium]
GDILVFLNADTRFDDPEMFFSVLVRTLEDPRVAAATCAVHIFPEEETLVDRAFHIVHNAYCRFLNLIGDGMGRGECQVVRRSVFDATGGYNPAMAAGEDYDLFRRIRKRGKIVFLPGVVLYESPRRFREYGYARVAAIWTKNALAVIWKDRSDSDHWEPVR